MNELFQTRRVMALAMVLMAIAACFTAPEASAAYEAIEVTATLDSGTSDTTVAVPIARSMIRDVILYSPPLDSGSTATLSHTVDALDDTYAPAGWSDKTIGATEDDDVIQANSSQLAVIVDGTANLNIQASDNQAADRVFRFRLLLEY